MPNKYNTKKKTVITLSKKEKQHILFLINEIKFIN